MTRPSRLVTSRCAVATWNQKAQASHCFACVRSCFFSQAYICARPLLRFRLESAGATCIMQRKPENGAKILIFKEAPLQDILSGRKTLEARGTNYRAGIYWLGFRGVIRGVAKLGPGTLVESDKDWQRLREEHLIQTASPPYPKTYLFEILSCEKRNIPFTHLKGAVSIVRYRGK